MRACSNKCPCYVLLYGRAWSALLWLHAFGSRPSTTVELYPLPTPSQRTRTGRCCISLELARHIRWTTQKAADASDAPREVESSSSGAINQPTSASLAQLFWLRKMGVVSGGFYRFQSPWHPLSVSTSLVGCASLSERLPLGRRCDLTCALSKVCTALSAPAISKSRSSGRDERGRGGELCVRTSITHHRVPSCNRTLVSRDETSG